MIGTHLVMEIVEFLIRVNLKSQLERQDAGPISREAGPGD